MFCFYRVLIYGSHAILINLCKDKNGKIPFSSASVVLLSEVIKVQWNRDITIRQGSSKIISLY